MTSKSFQIVNGITALVGFFGGMIAGKVFKTAEVGGTTFDPEITYKFNSALMVSIWIGTILLCLIFAGLGSILANQEVILNKLQNGNTDITARNTEEIKGDKTEEPKVNAKDIKEIMDNREPREYEVKCPNCGNIQYADTKRCLRCGQMIESKGE